MLAGGSGSALDVLRGQIIDDVVCADDLAQHYSLYLPSTFTPDRAWPVILAFDAGGRGRRGVERYQAGAERYGYIVAGFEQFEKRTLETQPRRGESDGDRRGEALSG